MIVKPLNQCYMQNFNCKWVSLFLAVSIFFSSCSSTTVITSEPPGAKVFINGQRVGTTPFPYRDTKVVGSCNGLSLELDGYEPVNTIFCRDEAADVGAIVGGLFVLVPFLWFMKYHPYRHYEMIPLQNESEPALSKANDHLNKDLSTKKVINSFQSKSDALRELKKLLDEGIITKEEFEAEKKKILEKDN
jgi:hypothetical protein